jgi:acetyl esterase/lipase
MDELLRTGSNPIVLPKLKLFCAFAIALSSIAGCATSGIDVERFQPPITTREAPERPITQFSLYNNTTRVGLGKMKAQVPAFNGKGELIASWTPHRDGPRNRPTFVVVHGGHGLVPTNFANAVWLRNTFEANVLVLDSYWSRGQNENWATRTRFGANMRVLDVIAAGRWLRDVHGTDPSQTFVWGDSQGGWTVLRAFTEDAFIKKHMGYLYLGGIAAYPNCFSHGTPDAPTLSPYFAPVIVFTGGKDSATPIGECPRQVLQSAASWVHYPDQTHGWDTANRGAAGTPVDGECGRAMNVYNQFSVCRSNRTTEDMRQRIKDFVVQFAGR